MRLYRAILLWTRITLPVCVKLCVSHWFRARVCSGHIPHHRCCSVYVISRVQIAFHTTQLHTTLNVFTSHIIPAHHTKRFCITPPFTSHHFTPHHSTSQALQYAEHKFVFYCGFHLTGWTDNVHGCSVSVWLYYLFYWLIFKVMLGQIWLVWTEVWKPFLFVLFFSSATKLVCVGFTGI